MAAEKRYVLDANAIVSALLLPSSVPRAAFDKADAGGRLLLSASTIAELDDVLRRPRLDRCLSEEDRLHFLVRLTRESVVVSPTKRIAACRDPRDNRYLELAVEGKATCIITGDRDLLALHPFRGIPILTPRQFLDDTQA